MIYLVSDPRATPNRTARNLRIKQYFEDRGLIIEEKRFSFLEGLVFSFRQIKSCDKIIFQISPRRNLLFCLLCFLRCTSIIECRDPICDHKTRLGIINLLIDSTLLLLVYLIRVPILQRENLLLHPLEIKLLGKRVFQSDFGVDLSVMPNAPYLKIMSDLRHSAVYAGEIYGQNYIQILSLLSDKCNISCVTSSVSNQLSKIVNLTNPVSHKLELFYYIQKFDFNIVINDRGPSYRPSKIYEALCLGRPILYVCTSLDDKFANLIIRRNLGQVYLFKDEMLCLAHNAFVSEKNINRVRELSNLLFSDVNYHRLLAEILFDGP